MQKIIYLITLIFFTVNSGFCGNKNAKQNNETVFKNEDSSEDEEKKLTRKRKSSILDLINSKTNIKKTESSHDFYKNGLAILNSGEKEIDYKEASKSFRQAYEKGHPEGALMLAKCYFGGLGVEQNIDNAETLFGVVDVKYAGQTEIYRCLCGLFEKSESNDEKLKKEKELLNTLVVLRNDANKDEKKILDFCTAQYLLYGIGIEKQEEDYLKYIEELTIPKIDQDAITNCFASYQESKSNQDKKE